MDLATCWKSVQSQLTVFGQAADSLLEGDAADLILLQPFPENLRPALFKLAKQYVKLEKEEQARRQQQEQHLELERLKYDHQLQVEKVKTEAEKTVKLEQLKTEAEVKLEQLKTEAEKTVKLEQLKTEAEMVVKLEQLQIEKLKIGDVGTLEQFLDSSLPPFKDVSNLSHSTSEARLRKFPNGVERWEDFPKRLREFRNSEGFKALSTAVGLIPLTKNTHTFQAFNEADVVSFLQTNVFSDFNNWVFNHRNIRLGPEGISHARSGHGLSVPDFVAFDSSEGRTSDAEGKVVVGKIILAGEVKRRNLTTGSNLDLVQLYVQGNKSVVDLIRQLGGYHISSNCRYGLATNGAEFWGTSLEENGTLRITKVFFGQDLETSSVRNMLCFLLTLAADDRTWNPPELEPVEKECLGGGKGGDGAKGRGEGGGGDVPKRKSRKDGNDEGAPDEKKPKREDGVGRGSKRSNFSCVKGTGAICVELASRWLLHSDRVTWLALFEKETMAAVKGFRTKEARDLEVRCYSALAPMQGKSIPSLLMPSCTLCDRGECFPAMVVSWVGELWKGNYLSLPTEPLESARALLGQMHQLGVAHGDVRPQNMNYNFKTKKLWIYDFGQATLRIEVSEKQFEMACRQDFEAIDVLIDSSKTDEARMIVYRE